LVKLVPTGVVTVTSTIPTVPGGDVVVIDVVLSTVNEAAGVVPNFTAVVPAKFVPVIVMIVPPPGEPLFGESEVTVGASV
jgi:hypothetical protein